MSLKTLLPLLLVVGVSSCKSPEKPKQNTALEDVVWVTKECLDADNEEILCPYSFLRFYKDGTFSGGALRGYVSGIWKGDSVLQQILIIPDSLSSAEERSPALFRLSYQSSNYLNLGMIRNKRDIKNGNIQQLKLKAALVDMRSDPFSHERQTWRIKPPAPETTEQIKIRTLAYMNFLQQFFNFAAANKIDRPDTEWFPNVMEMDSPGTVRMAYSNEINDWYDCFYNEEQAVEGYKLISGPFLKVKLRGIKSISERNADVAGQILAGMEGKQ